MVPFDMPPWLYNQRNQLRSVGFELEYAGPELDQVAQLVQRRFGGQHRAEGTFAHKVTDTRFGTFSIESDSAFLKQAKYEATLSKLGMAPADTAIGEAVETALARVTAKVLPSEVVTPPIPLSELDQVEQLRAAMHEVEAMGTKATLLSAFGLHINPDAPAHDADTLLAFLRAYFLLEAWIIRESNIDIARRIAPFIRPVPPAYVELVLGPGYAPSRAQLIDDYLDHVPSRNHPLDMLPLFAYIDKDRVLAKAKEPQLLKPRPTFHYRLPNCELGDPAWTIAGEWNRWVVVERLVAEPATLERMCTRYLTLARAHGDGASEQWIEECRRWQR